MLIDAPEIVYPSSDGKRMADNTLQFRWIVMIEGGLESVFLNDPNVFVAGDLLWYPVQGEPKICAAPDAMVAIGRPKGDRRSYKQWEEADIAPQVVFEVLSLSNDAWEMEEKRMFYEEHGVAEYYLYDPYQHKLAGWRRQRDELRRIWQVHGWISPLLKIRFEVHDELEIFGPDGARFLKYTELIEDRNRQQQRTEQEKQRAEHAEQRYSELLAQLQRRGIEPEGLPPAE